MSKRPTARSRERSALRRAGSSSGASFRLDPPMSFRAGVIPGRRILVVHGVLGRVAWRRLVRRSWLLAARVSRAGTWMRVRRIVAVVAIASRPARSAISPAARVRLNAMTARIGSGYLTT